MVDKSRLIFLYILLVVVAQDQLDFTIKNFRVGAPILVCSIDIMGAPGPQWKLDGFSGVNVPNITVTPSNTLGKYHIVPSELYDCTVLYQTQATYAIEAVGNVVSGRKFVSLVINQWAIKGYPLGVSAISVWQNSTSQLYCGLGNCGSGGSILGSVAAATFECHVQ